MKETCQHDQPHCSTLFRFGSWDADLCSAPAPKPGDVWKQAWEVAGSEERRRDDALGCHVRTSCHVKYCFVRGVERPLIGYLPRSQPGPRLLWHFWNPIIGKSQSQNQGNAILHQRMRKCQGFICLYFTWSSLTRAAGVIVRLRMSTEFYVVMVLLIVKAAQ